jgi:hypothetical protein
LRTLEQTRVPVFHVRHVDIDDAIQQGQRLGTVVAAGVVDQWQAQTAAGGDLDGTDDLCDHVTRRDQVDVVAALPLQGEHHPGQFIRLDLMPRALVADVPVLAKDAAQIAPAEENGARTA